MKDFKVIISGPKEFKDYEFLKTECDRVLSRKLVDSEVKVTIMSGCSSGVENLGERYAKERGLAVQTFPADWNKLGKKAGILRHKRMAKESNACILFFMSAGGETMNRITKTLLSIAKEEKLLIREIEYKMENEEGIK